MYKVLLADDESIIRKGLKNIINWDDYDCEVVAEAADGYEGLEMIEKYQPDIIFTDIRMPVMDGLEMVEQIERDSYSPKVIILTGFSDFGYAKEAIALGVSEFLLKPTKLEEIKSTISKVVKEINKEAEESREIEKIYNRYNKSVILLQEKLLYEVMVGITREKDEIISQAKELELNIQDYYLVVVGFSGEEKETSVENMGVMHTFIDMLLEAHDAYSIVLDECKYALIINAGEEDDNNLRKQINNLQQSVSDNLGLDVAVTLSSKHSKIETLNQSYSECRYIMEYDSLFDKKNIYASDSRKNSADTSAIYAGIKKIILDTISYGVETTTKQTVRELLSQVHSDDDTVIAWLISIINEIGAMLPDWEKNIETEDIDSLKTEITSLAVRATQFAIEDTNEQTKLIVKKAQEYLKENYYRHVTLAEVSKTVYVSTYYISRVFRKETGMTITEYINQIRIEKACTLLKDIKLKVYQIGDMVGIADPHYFSRLFKKSLGMTPSEYRNTHIEDTNG